MSIVMAGLMVSISGMAVVAAVIFGLLPKGNTTLEYALIGIGWLFIIIGMIIRWKGLKLEKQQEEMQKK